MYSKSEVKDTLRASSCVLYGAVGLFVLSALLTLGWLLFLKPVRNAQTDIYRQSHGYVEAKQALLLSLLEDYQQLEGEIAAAGDAGVIAGKEAQQRAIVSRMKTEVQRIAPEFVPVEVKEFLARHSQ